MAATRMQGITVDTNGNFIIDKEHRGVRICLRLGKLSQRNAEQRLDAEIARVESELEHKAASHPRFADCAARYLAESQHKRSVSLVAWHIRLLYPYLGNLEVNRVHDRTLEPFIADRRAAGVTATTINRSLEVVRTILNRAARAYRDDDGRPWLDALPPVITMLPETPRAALPDHLGGARPTLPEVVRTPRSYGALRRQYWLAREQCVRTGMGVGGARARGRPQCVRDPA